MSPVNHSLKFTIQAHKHNQQSGTRSTSCIIATTPTQKHSSSSHRVQLSQMHTRQPRQQDLNPGSMQRDIDTQRFLLLLSPSVLRTTSCSCTSTEVRTSRSRACRRRIRLWRGRRRRRCGDLSLFFLPICNGSVQGRLLRSLFLSSNHRNE